MRNALFTIVLTTLSAVGVVSCGSSASSLDPNTRVADLNTDQQKQLCDEIASAQGGYGRSATCPDGSTQRTDPNQAECMSAFPVLKQFCPDLTVGDNLNCVDSTGHDLCDLTTAACKAVRDCLATVKGG